MKTKIAIVGNTGVGKTSLVKTYTGNKFPNPKEEDVPHVYEKYNATVIHEGEYIEAELEDKDGDGDCAFLAESDCVIVCFSVVDESSFKDVQKKWFPLINKRFKKAEKPPPVVLVGTKMDLRTDKKKGVTKATGEKAAKKLKAFAYVECSAKDFKNEKDPFRECYKAFFDKGKKKNESKKKKKFGIFSFLSKVDEVEI